MMIVDATPGISLDNIAALSGYSRSAVRSILNVLQSHEEAHEDGGVNTLTAKGQIALKGYAV